ncbi:MAG: alpha-mannosidase [Gemmatimonadota bacterium]|nr:MAG: alpha-mannosidase [Gemmatimonadota bacterium]
MPSTHSRTIHLLCNSHLDPVWLWEWPEGAGEALALTRTVCDLCEEFPGFVFNRNEAQFYEWVEEYDPELFERIRRLIARGQWHVMGGWYVQPDCNMPSGESFVRQILVGKRYFQEKFGVEPRTAVNLDPFGHTRGLVQILHKSGYDSYWFCRPKVDEAPLPAAEFSWVGYDGSRITAAVAESHYNSAPGAAKAKITEWMARDAHKQVCQIPWGVGNHGGGPSKQDLRDIETLINASGAEQILHSTPERYFDDLRSHGVDLPAHEADLNPWAVGCYTSMMRLKQWHRRLENELYMTEKMATIAWAQGLVDYPAAELGAATRAMLANEFHDILPGTSIPSVERAAIAELGHGLTITSRAKTRAFYALASGQTKGRTGTHPILVFNPHPFTVNTIVECEVQPAWPDREDQYGIPTVTAGQRHLPAQAEQQESNINEDHRKRVVFAARLRAGSMNRFTCRFEKVPRKPAGSLRIRDGKLRFRTRDLDVVISARSGLLDRYRSNGVDYVTPGALAHLVMQDNADPWGMTVARFRKPAGRFKLMTRSDAASSAGVVAAKIPAVRIIEDGPVRSVVEALFRYGDSVICQHYKLPHSGTELELVLRVLWQEKDRMLKLSLPTPWNPARLLAQVAYGVQELPDSGDECVAQKWLSLVSHEHSRALSVINDSTYGCDFKHGELRISLLRAAAHAGHPTGTGRPIVQQDRFIPRIDQGEHVFRFWLNGGGARDRLRAVDREALTHNERPYALSYSPSGRGRRVAAGPTLSDRTVQVTCFKRAADGDDLIVRLFEPTGIRRSTILSLAHPEIRHELKMEPFEIKTVRVDHQTGQVREVSLLEE